MQVVVCGEGLHFSAFHYSRFTDKINAGESAYSYYEYYEEELPVIMSNVTCGGDESRLIDCPFTSGGNGSPVSLTCSSESK